MKQPHTICIKTHDNYYKRHLTHFLQEKDMVISDDADIADLIIFHSSRFSDAAPAVINKFRLKSNIPIIALSNGYTPKAILLLYDSGIDFCGTLPMLEEEIYLRALVFIRRSFTRRDTVSYTIGDVTLSGMRLIFANGTKILINQRPYQLIHFLFEGAGAIVYTQDVIAKAYGISDKGSMDYYYAKKTIDSYFSRIRKYLADTSVEIVTIHRRGWILREKIKSVT